MELLLWIVGFCLLGSVISAAAAGVFLLVPGASRQRMLPLLVSFATGTLLGAAFLALLPEAVAEIAPERAMATVLGGILVFFLLEKLLLWRHCHRGACDLHGHGIQRGRTAGILVLFGDSLHNFVDGALIGAAFLTSIELGIVTAVAVAAHELPQELGDIAVLLQGGWSRGRAFGLNLLSGTVSVAGGLIAYFALSAATGILPYALAIAAASFMYIAIADLMPGLHERTELGASVLQAAWLTAGVLLIYGSHRAMH